MNVTSKTKQDVFVEHEDEAAAREIAQACSLSSLTSRVLVSRGIDSVELAREFLTPSLERDWLAPEQIPGLVEIADAVERAIREGKRILVFGDFDVDGITATAVSVRGLRALGATVYGLIPHRYNEGYALSEAAVERGVGTFQPDLIMTVDCGISCRREVEDVLAKGIDCVITDHHEPGENVPQGVPVADPKCDPNCKSRDLAGAGVALKLICMLGKRMGKPGLWRELTDFAALGTIADLMPLRGENRALVADGVGRIRNNPRVCMLELAAVSGIEPEELTSTKLSFSLIPRMNAAGRMGDATIALELLLSDDHEQAQHLASELEGINRQRRDVESELAEQVEEQLSTAFEGEEAIVVAGEGWHEGVKGIVASRIARSYKRPTIIFSIDGDQARGSGRTYGDINLFELAGTCSDLFEKFGGHAAAIGITLDADKLPEFKRRLCERMRQVQLEELPSGIKVDALAHIDECSVEVFDELELLQPYGNSNNVPLLAIKNVFLENRSSVGKLGNHFRYFASDGVSQAAGIFFGPDNLDELIDYDAVCDVVFEPSVDEWRGRRSPKLMTRKILLNNDAPARAPQEEAQGAPSITERIDELFTMQNEICEVGEYAGITRVARFNTKVVGVTFENRQSVLASLEAGVELSLVRRPSNEYDPNAIAVELKDGTQLGFLNRHLARRIAPVMDEGIEYDAAVSAVTGGPAQDREHQDTRIPGPLGVRDPGVIDRSYGVNIVVRRVDLDLAQPSCGEEDQRELLEKTKRRWQSMPPEELDANIVRTLIGEHTPHDAQKQALQSLARKENTLVVMATGRGKSFIFHMHAAKEALVGNTASVFIYPLRALVADQAFHLQESFGQFGLSVRVLTGESDNAERDSVFSDLKQGALDVVLTTPEFLSIHAERFAASGRVGFVVVDEAHHIGQARAGNRPAYANLNETLVQLGNPLVLAVTATAGVDEARVIRETLSIQTTVLDPTVRENLHIDDKRDVRNRDSYLASIVAEGAKCVIYVNSRDQSVSLTRTLRHRLPQIAPYIGFYNAGLSKSDRKAIEAAFRAGDLCCIVSTSAFGEGIDIPDIEHVVLYHLPFNEIEFNQMSGRAGRDGRESTIHMLFSYGDARINEKILSSGAPSRESLAVLYRVLRKHASQAKERGEEGFSCTNTELAEQANRLDRAAKLDESSVSCGISVFRELGFLHTSGHSIARYIHMQDNPSRMDLEDSVRYREGIEELQDFKTFKNWALSSEAQELLERFNRPILPEE